MFSVLALIVCPLVILPLVMVGLICIFGSPASPDADPDLQQVVSWRYEFPEVSWMTFILLLVVSFLLVASLTCWIASVVTPGYICSRHFQFPDVPCMTFAISALAKISCIVALACLCRLAYESTLGQLVANTIVIAMARLEMRTSLFSYIVLHDPCEFGQDISNRLNHIIASADLSYIICSKDVENICILCLNCLAFCTLSCVSIRMLCWIVKCWAFLLSYAFRPKLLQLTYTNSEPSEQEPEQSEEKSEQSEDIVDITEPIIETTMDGNGSDSGDSSSIDSEEEINNALERISDVINNMTLCNLLSQFHISDPIDAVNQTDIDDFVSTTDQVASPVATDDREGGARRRRGFFICLAVCLSVSIVGNVFLLFCSYLLYAAQGYHRYDPLIV